MALDAATIKNIRETYPAFAYLLDIPEIADLFAQAVKEGWAPAVTQAKLYATRWWKTRSATQRQWETLYRTDPAEANRQRTQRRSEVYAEAARLGVRVVHNEMVLIAERSLAEGWTPAQITQAILNLTAHEGAKGISGTGEIRSTMDQLRALTKQYAHNVSTGTLQTWAQRILAGTLTEDGVRSWLVTNAKRRLDPDGTNVTLQRGLDAGLTVRDVYSGVIETVANELEIDSSKIDLASGHWGKLLQFTDEKGRQVPMNETQAIQWARNQGDWQLTNTAREAYTGLADAMTKKWGMR